MATPHSRKGKEKIVVAKITRETEREEHRQNSAQQALQPDMFSVSPLRDGTQMQAIGSNCNTPIKTHTTSIHYGTHHPKLHSSIEVGFSMSPLNAF